MGAFHDPRAFEFTAALEAAFEPLRDEVARLRRSDYREAPDSLTTVAHGYDETGWLWFGLFGEGAELEAHRARCPLAARACAAVPGLVNAGISLFRPGTHLYPHRGELRGVLRCHLPLSVPHGDVALRSGDEVRPWVEGQCLVFDDTIEHEAWNHTAADRVVLIVTFARSARGRA